MKKLILLMIFCFIFFPMRVDAGEKTVKFTWNQEITDDFAGWTLYHSTDNSTWNKYSKINYNGTKQNIYTSKQIINSADDKKITHYFKLTARDKNGNESNFSNIVSGVIDFKSPNVPDSFKCKIITK